MEKSRPMAAVFGAVLALLPGAVRALPSASAFGGRLPLQFTANQGQADPQAKFLARSSDSALFVTPTGAAFVLSRAGKTATLRLTLAGANPAADVTGESALPGRSNYFVGKDPKRWRIGLANYARVRCRHVYPGIDMVYHGTQQQLEYDFDLAPHADPTRIQLRFDGASSVTLEPGGALVAQTAAGPVRWQKPSVFQEIGGKHRPVEGGYQQGKDGVVSFRLGAYDKNKPLVVDPTCVYSTFLGGSVSDGGVGIAADASGSAYVAGYTFSTDFPIVNAGVDVGYTGDIFVSKLSPDGSSLIYSTYIGSRAGNFEAVDGIAVDKKGAVYVAGHTMSDDFPVTPGAFQPQRVPRSSYDTFVVKLSPNGAQLMYSTLIGGKEADIAHGIAVDSQGQAVVAGETTSTDFPATLPFTPNTPGSWRTFLTKFNAAGTGLVYSVVFPETDRPALAVDREDSAYLTGRVISTKLPTTPGAFQPAKGREFNASAFLAKFDGQGELVYCTYLGGPKTGDDETGQGVAVNDAGEAYVVGDTVDDDFPTVNPAQPLKADAGGYNDDVFVSKFSADGHELLFSTYLGGKGYDLAHGVALDARGNAWVTGSTASPDFPLKNPWQAAHGGLYDLRNQNTPLNFIRSQDAFVAQFSPDGALLFSTFLGGSESDSGTAIAADGAGHVYLTGATASENFPIYHAGQAVNRRMGLNSPYDENKNAFVVKIAGDP